MASEYHKTRAREAGRALLAIAVHVGFGYPDHAPARATCRAAIEALLFPLNGAGDPADPEIGLGRVVPVLTSLECWARASERTRPAAHGRLQLDLRRYYAHQAAERMAPLLQDGRARA